MAVIDFLIYFIAGTIIWFIQLLPLDVVARFGRFLGGLVHLLDARHRRVATRNMTMCFGHEKSPAEIKAMVKENFKRIGENFASAMKSASMSDVAMADRIKVIGAEHMLKQCAGAIPKSGVVAIGHFGNFELYARARHIIPTHKAATTYRAIRPPAIDRLLKKMRLTSGALYFERRTEGGALRNALQHDLVALGLLSDQHSGDHGVRIPFLGHDCNTSKAPAVYALRFGLPLFTAVCFRTKLAHWEIEVSPEIPTVENGQPRSIEAIMTDVNHYLEAAVRRDPANWFWVHNRWKGSKVKGRRAQPAELSPDEEPNEASTESKSESTTPG